MELDDQNITLYDETELREIMESFIPLACGIEQDSSGTIYITFKEDGSKLTISDDSIETS